MRVQQSRGGRTELRGPHPLFLDHLDVTTRARLLAQAQQHRFSAGTVLTREGAPGEGLFVTVSGLIKVFKTSVQGREQVLRYAPPGSSFNEVTALDGGPNPTSALAVVETEVTVISPQLMKEWLRTDPRVSLAIIDSFTGLYRHLMELVEDLSFRNISDRVARVLLQSVAPHAGMGAGADLTRRLTQEEIAEMIGSTREVVARALRGLEDAGTITVDRGTIILLDRNHLESGC